MITCYHEYKVKFMRYNPKGLFSVFFSLWSSFLLECLDIAGLEITHSGGSGDFPKGHLEDFHSWLWLFASYSMDLRSAWCLYFLPSFLTRRKYHYMLWLPESFQNPTRTQPYSLCLSEYDLVSPYEVDHNGDYVSHEITRSRRRRRGLAPLRVESLHLRLKGFRHDFHVELKASSNLMAPGFMVQTLGKGGTKSVHTFPPEDFCFYQGSLRSHKNSSVALSTCRGLVSAAWVPVVCEGGGAVSLQRL